MAGTVSHAAVKGVFQKKIDGMKAATAKARKTWTQSYEKRHNTKKAELMMTLEVKLDVAKAFVDSIDGTNLAMRHALFSIGELVKAADAAKDCWTKRKDGEYTQEELAAEHTEFNKHCNRLAACFKK